VRRRTERLAHRKAVGQQMRAVLGKQGVAVWPPSWDLRWQEWVGNYGDEAAKKMLEAFEQALRARAAQIEAHKAAESAE
jgi:hypothetical protein